MTIAQATEDLLDAMTAFGTAAADRFKGGGKLQGPSYTEPQPVAYSATPTFDAALTNVFHLAALTGDVTAPVITNPHDGQTISIRVKQDGTGGHAFTLPADAHAAGAISTDADDVSLLVLTYDLADTRWEGSWTTVAF